MLPGVSGFNEEGCAAGGGFDLDVVMAIGGPEEPEAVIVTGMSRLELADFETGELGADRGDEVVDVAHEKSFRGERRFI